MSAQKLRGSKRGAELKGVRIGDGSLGKIQAGKFKEKNPKIQKSKKKSKVWPRLVTRISLPKSPAKSFRVRGVAHLQLHEPLLLLLLLLPMSVCRVCDLLVLFTWAWFMTSECYFAARGLRGNRRCPECHLTRWRSSKARRTEQASR